MDEKQRRKTVVNLLDSLEHPEENNIPSSRPPKKEDANSVAFLLEEDELPEGPASLDSFERPPKSRFLPREERDNIARSFGLKTQEEFDPSPVANEKAHLKYLKQSLEKFQQE